jgi:hypothetical protein
LNVCNALPRKIHLSGCNPGAELCIDRRCHLLEDERCVVEVEGEAAAQFVGDGDRREVVAFRRQMDGDEAGLFAEGVVGKLISFKVALLLPAHSFKAVRSKRLKVVEKRNFRQSPWHGGVGVFEEFEDVFFVFGDKGVALVAAVEVMERLIQLGPGDRSAVRKRLGELNAPHRESVGLFVGEILQEVERDEEKDEKCDPFNHSRSLSELPGRDEGRARDDGL